MSDTKSKIIKWVREIDQFKTKNKECSEVFKIIVETGEKIGKIYPKIHNEEYSSQKEMEELMMQISVLSQEKREAEKKYKEIMDNNFDEFKTKFSKIYELATSEEGIDQQTLNHVLNTYIQYKNGHLSKDQGTNRGIDYMKVKFNLPSDFLNYVPE